MPGFNLMDRQYRESRLYTHPAREVFSRTEDVLKGMGFEIDTRNPSRGEMTASSRVLPGSTAELKRQRRAIVLVRWTPEAMTEVKIGFWESTGEDTRYETGVSSEKLLRGGALYDAFWAHMAEALPLELPPPAPTEPRET